MLKKIACYILIFSFFGSQFSTLSIFLNFKINQDFIAKVLCINKDKPKSTCNGKCYLSKQLKEQEQQDEKQVPKHRNGRVEVLFCDNFQISYNISRSVFLEKKVPLPNHFIFSTQEFIDDVFHPPQLG